MPPRAAWCVWSCKRQRRCGARGDRPRPRHSGGGTRACAQALSARRRRGLGERQRPRARAGGRDRQAASCRIHFDYVQGGQRRARTANLSATRRRHRVMAATILIIEDDASMRAGLRDNLEVEGYRVVTASSVREGRELARHAKSDLFLLDVMLPDGDGVSLCRSLRSEGLQQPIIMLTARGEEIDKVLGLEVGADDYLTKPFSLRELLARIHARLRRDTARGGATAGIVTVGRAQIDLRGLKLLRAGVAGASPRAAARTRACCRWAWDSSFFVVINCCATASPSRPAPRSSSCCVISSRTAARWCRARCSCARCGDTHARSCCAW